MSATEPAPRAGTRPAGCPSSSRARYQCPIALPLAARRHASSGCHGPKSSRCSRPFRREERPALRPAGGPINGGCVSLRCQSPSRAAGQTMVSVPRGRRGRAARPTPLRQRRWHIAWLSRSGRRPPRRRPGRLSRGGCLRRWPGAGEDEAVLVALDDVTEPFGARHRAEEEEQEREPQALAVFERDRLELPVGAMEGGDLAAVANGDAVALELAHEVVGHRLAQIRAAVEQRHERAAASEPDRGLPGRVPAADDGDALGAAQLGLGRPGGVEDADALVLGRGRRPAAAGTARRLRGGRLARRSRDPPRAARCGVRCLARATARGRAWPGAR